MANCEPSLRVARKIRDSGKELAAAALWGTKRTKRVVAAGMKATPCISIMVSDAVFCQWSLMMMDLIALTLQQLDEQSTHDGHGRRGMGQDSLLIPFFAKERLWER